MYHRAFQKCGNLEGRTTFGLVAGEMGHLLFTVAFQSEIDEAVDQARISQAAGGPQLWGTHADRSKSG